MQALGIIGFLLCTISVLSLLMEIPWLGKMTFGTSVVCLMCSLVLSLWEVLLSTRALDYVLDDFDRRIEKND
uniref:Uncharacterized protein n=1 Tax=Candidatus Kentrum sp. LFY TaxID=2126342 RepID=A0A450UZW0_9GAMM|nr:MAG: Protein of unknown function (DUF2721) [Candidatus Kentron sp. LFY]